MRRSLLSLLACPNCSASLEFGADATGNQLNIVTGSLVCSGCAEHFPVDRGIPRLLPKSLLDPQRDEMKARDEQVAMYDGNVFLGLFGKVEIPVTLRHLAPNPDDRVIEAGCGTGRMTKEIAPRVRELVSIDFSFQSLLSNQEKLLQAGMANVHLIQGDICNLPLMPGIFDRAVSCQVLEHVPGDRARRQAIESISRVTKSGGAVVITAYRQAAGMGAKEGRHKGGIPFYRFSKYELEQTLSAGLNVEQITGSLGYLYLARCRTPVEIPPTSIIGGYDPPSKSA